MTMQRGTEQPGILDILATPVDILVRRDTDNTFEATIEDGNQVAIDITNDTVVMKVYDKPGGTEKISKSNAPGSHYVPASGLTRFAFTDDELTPAGTDAEHTLHWWYEIRRVETGGAEYVHLEGAFTVLPSGREHIFTYQGDPDGRILDALRLEIGDTDINASEILTDSEIAYYAKRYDLTDVEAAPTVPDDENNLLMAAYAAAQALVGKFAKEASYSAGGMSESANQKAAEVRRRARELRKRATAAATPFAGGRSTAAKEASRTSGRPQSTFTRGMMENS